MLSVAEITEINAGVDLRSLAASLGAVFRGRARHGACPICGGGPTAARFEIKQSGGVERWVCAVCCDGGDAIKLLRKVKALGFKAAVAELGGQPGFSRVKVRRREDERAAKASKAAIAQEKARERARRKLYALWRGALPIAGTPVEAYLRGRGLTWRLDALRLRYYPDLPYFNGETIDETGQRRPRLVWRGPAMLAPLVGPDGRFAGVHITWIDAARPGSKATIRDPETGEALPAKKMRGHKQGGFLDVFPGGDPQCVYLGEGIESVASVRQWRRDGAVYRVAGDLGNLAGKATATLLHPKLRDAGGRPRSIPGPEPDLDALACPVPAECRDLVLLKDGDSDPVLTDSAMLRAAARHRRAGRRIAIADPGVGVDFNDLARAS